MFGSKQALPEQVIATRTMKMRLETEPWHEDVVYVP